MRAKKLLSFCFLVSSCFTVLGVGTGCTETESLEQRTANPPSLSVVEETRNGLTTVSDKAASSNYRIRKQDEYWRISTRQLNQWTDPPAVQVSRFINGDWQSSVLESLLHPLDESITTVFYIHGYTFDEEKTEWVGNQFYDALTSDLDEKDRLRFIVWSWPSTEQKFRLMADMREKARRTDFEACCLGWTLAKMPQSSKICLVASSMGARGLTGALHLAAGGKMGEWKLPVDAVSTSANRRALVISAAMHSDWLYPDKRHEEALSAVERLLLVNNSVDPKLKRYAMMYSKSRPKALGYTGLESPEKLGEFATRLEQWDASEEIGENHGVEHYLQSPEVMSRIRAFAFWKER